jgi:hypothetical protein
MNGNFIDTKIFAFSRRSREPGRVTAPKALFVNAHVLATACSYFESGTPFLFFGDLPSTIPIAFDFSDGIATSLNAGLPPGVAPFFEMEEHNSDSDYDGPVEAPAKARPPIGVTASALPERAVKAYVVKYTAYRTFVGNSRNTRCPLMGEIQPACDHLVYLFRRDLLLST